jgi:DNA-binding transcriptional regulator YiaG
MAKKAVEMTGDQLREIRVGVFAMTQPEFAKLLGVDFRTIVRLESLDAIPTYHARHVRCIEAAKKKS